VESDLRHHYGRSDRHRAAEVIEVWILIVALVAATAIVVARSGVVSAGSGSSAASPLPADTSLPGGHNDWDGVIRAALSNAGFWGSDVDRYGILVKAIIENESGWWQTARGDYTPNLCGASYRGYRETAGYCALGLGQIHRYYHPDLATQFDLMDGSQNIAAMAILLWQLRAVVGDDMERIAAAYNGGQAAGLAWPNVSTQVSRYVANVTGRVQALSGALTTGA
jgi:hypothetical protein